MIIEPILREPGSVSFSWMEIQRTKASLVQQLSQQTNNTANETLLEFGLFPKDGECEHRCPELNACIASNLWCDGKCRDLWQMFTIIIAINFRCSKLPIWGWRVVEGVRCDQKIALNASWSLCCFSVHCCGDCCMPDILRGWHFTTKEKTRRAKI